MSSAGRSSSWRSLPLTLCLHLFSVMSSVFIVTGSIALMIAGACWVRLQRGVHLSQKEKPHAFNNLFRLQPAERRLMFQHQQIHRLTEHSGASTDEENDDGDFTVYECPGLAPSAEMEVRNPLFDDAMLHFHRFHK